MAKHHGKIGPISVGHLVHYLVHAITIIPNQFIVHGKYIDTNVRWVVEFLTRVYKISDS